MRLKKIALLGGTGILALTLSAGVAYAVPSVSTSLNNQGNAITENVATKEKVETHQERGAELAGILGMDANVFSQELKSGKTLAQIAATKGMDANTLTQKLQALFNDKIDKAVANGKLTADKAATMKTKTAERAASEMNKTWTGHERKDGKKESVFKNVRQQIPALLGIDATQLKEQLKSGKSLAQVAQDKKINKTDLVSKVQLIMKANLDQAVKDKTITADQATQIASKLPQMIEHMVTRTDSDKENLACAKPLA